MNKQIWYDQRKFNKRFFRDNGLNLDSLPISEKIHWAKEFHFHICRELSDLMNCLPEWKMHYKNNSNNSFIDSNIREEFIDVFKYLMGLGQVLGISYSNIINSYQEKTDVVLQKYQQNLSLAKLKQEEVIIFDIDGVINNYPICFFDWVEKNFKIKCKEGEDLKLKVDLRTYNEIKEAYRTCGVKRNLTINKSTVLVMNELKKRGEKIVLYTVRPVLKYKRIYSDTLYWLRKNKIPFEAIFWSDYYKEDIYQLGMKIKFIVEDNRENAILFNHEGYRVFLLDNLYNQGKVDKLTKRIKSPFEILKFYDSKKNNFIKS